MRILRACAKIRDERRPALGPGRQATMWQFWQYTGRATIWQCWQNTGTSACVFGRALVGPGVPASRWAVAQRRRPTAPMACRTPPRTRRSGLRSTLASKHLGFQKPRLRNLGFETPQFSSSQVWIDISDRTIPGAGSKRAPSAALPRRLCRQIKQALEHSRLASAASRGWKPVGGLAQYAWVRLVPAALAMTPAL